MDVLNAVVQGLLIGGLYTTTALGLTLIFGVLRMVNLAHGEFVLLGGYVSYLIVTHLGIDPLVSLPLVAVVGAAAGWLLHRGLLAKIGEFGPEQLLVATFGISLLLQAGFSQYFGHDPKSIPASYGESGVSLLGVRVQAAYVIVFAVSVVLTAAVWFLIERTRWGAAVRASGKQPEVAALVGIDVRRIHAMVFALATAVAMISGVMVGVTASFTPVSGATYLVFGFTVVVLGGIGNIRGTFIAALCIGMIQSLSTLVIGGGYRDLVIYVLFLAMLAFRPQGLSLKAAKI